MKKFISVCLVASMVASMGVTAFADDNKYEAKDKDLKFYGEYFYDGKGADELWLPIVVEKGGKTQFVTDSSNSAEKVAEEMLADLIEAQNDWLAMDSIIKNLPTGTPEALKAHTEGEMKKAGFPVWTVSDQYVDGKTMSDKDYRDEIIKTYTMGLNAPVKAFKASAENCAQVIEMLGFKLVKEEIDHEGEKIEVVVDFEKAADSKFAETIDVDDIEDVNDVEIEWKAKRGGNLVADVYIDEVDDLGGLTCVVFELTDHLGIAVQYINGTLKMENGKNRELDEQDIRYNYYGLAAYSVTEYQQTVGDIDNGYEVNGTDNYINLVDFNEKYHYVFFKKNVDWVEIEDNQGFYYEVDVAEQGKINLVYNNEAIDAVTEIASADAVLAFYNFEARPVFDFAGKVTLTPPDEFLEEKSIEELYLYTYEKDGSLKRVKQAKVGEDGDTLEFRTNTLGKFVLSSEELTLLSDAERAALESLKEAEANGETVVEEAAVVVDENKANPGTGC